MGLRVGGIGGLFTVWVLVNWYCYIASVGGLRIEVLTRWRLSASVGFNDYRSGCRISLFLFFVLSKYLVHLGLRNILSTFKGL